MFVIKPRTAPVEAVYEATCKREKLQQLSLSRNHPNRFQWVPLLERTHPCLLLCTAGDPINAQCASQNNASSHSRAVLASSGGIWHSRHLSPDHSCASEATLHPQGANPAILQVNKVGR
eukprot:scpid16115/ scgid31098/ 